MANAQTVIIGCRLPHGIILTVKTASGEKLSAMVNGMNSSKLLGATFTTTKIDAELWETWKKNYSDYQPLKSGAIFVASTQDQADYKGKELAKVKTGFEPMNPDEALVKPRNDKD